MADSVLFSGVVENEFLKEHKSFFEESNTLKQAYFLGAYCNGVIGQSYFSKISPKNITFKKWLSNQVINSTNLLKIHEKAYYFHRKLQLFGNRLEDLRTLLTRYTSDGKNPAKSKVSFAFSKGYCDYEIFKDKHPSKEDKNQNSEGEKNGQ
ncbi:MAG: hypothetical protein GXX07_10570 [Wolinella succinogenes]|uniref:hypothetical protein n=1 Tax=Wolinella succinogenes TaxID=844 RepID=UPI00169FDC4C|nr:hypothetical protein [Wolinella succinogenes]NLU35394.1 hypothetical protein [Wolinella succinogenes]